MKSIKFLQCDATNYEKGRTMPIEYIVVHYTANNGDKAGDNALYFANNKNLSASAHYFVDENEVWQSVNDTDTAWHCGGKLQGSEGHTLYGICRNANSLGVELCSKRDGGGRFYFNEATVLNASGLIKELMEKYGLGAGNVVRHFDVTGKNCPAPFLDEAQWAAFKEKLSAASEKARYKQLRDVPEAFRPVIEKLMNAQIIKGDGSDKQGNNDVIDLSHDMVRLLVIMSRAGVFDSLSAAAHTETQAENK
ncbi:MAG: N-acetylmuramoyl-L-alanine amidase family protein [Oscillospiraceae bacterium]